MVPQPQAKQVVAVVNVVVVMDEATARAELRVCMAANTVVGQAAKVVALAVAQMVAGVVGETGHCS